MVRNLSVSKRNFLGFGVVTLIVLLSGVLALVQMARVHGALSACRAVEAGGLHCRWRDPFGAGDLHVQADADGSGFRARWSTDDIHGELDWDGRRVACLDGPE